MPRQRRSVFGLGMLLLAHKLYQTGIKHLPPVTLICILAQIALYMGVLNPPWDRHEVCLSGESILYYKDYRRLFLSAVEHTDDIHLYHNMASLIFKGRSLEKKFGSMKFLITLVAFVFSTSWMYVGLAKMAYNYTDEYSYMTQCAIGFSGVLFALKVLTTYYSGNAEQYIHGFFVPSKYAVWIELLIIHILVPRASFIGHLAGILVGIVFVQGPLRIIVDAVCNLLNSVLFANSYSPSLRPSYTYSHGSAASEQQQNSGGSYGWNYGRTESYPSAPQDTGYLSPEELRRRRMNRFD